MTGTKAEDSRGDMPKVKTIQDQTRGNHWMHHASLNQNPTKVETLSRGRGFCSHEIRGPTRVSPNLLNRSSRRYQQQRYIPKSESQQTE
uniref:Uncharacterized protein n=1 Tax=Brassica oleracea TaxID=3712 RepID=A0A3P6G3U1_BRAOL|nr:unnamed protein product [Brassica oleracea]